MKKENNSIKDFLYDYADYFVILIIVIFVIGILAWRLDILFPENYGQDNETHLLSKNNNELNKVKKELDKKNKVQVEDKNDNLKQESNPKDKNIHKEIMIPSGANSGMIGDILKDNGIINDSALFVDKCEDMNLSNKLKSGEYELSPNDSLEDIIRKISK